MNQSRTTVVRGKLPVIQVKNRFAEAEISQYAAHVLSYTPAGASDLLWMSEKSFLEAGKTIRGGVPVCWPYFGPATIKGNPSHGFARVSEWQYISSEELDNGATRLVFELPAGSCPAPYEHLSARYEITIGSSLHLKLVTVNHGDAPFELGDAFHTYFRVGDVRQVQVAGLEETTFVNKLNGEKSIQHGAVIVAGEVDRVYVDTDKTCIVHDPVLKRELVIAKQGSRSTVVWNPWIDKSKSMADFGDDEFETMICVETVNADIDKRIVLPGHAHTLESDISVR